MAGFFTRERFGRPQFLAGLLLVFYLGQCGWLVRRGVTRGEWDADEEIRLVEGMRQWRGTAIAGTSIQGREVFHAPVPLELENGHDRDHSPLWYLIGSAPLAVWPGSGAVSAAQVRWLARIPSMIFGVLLGASLWYVARRLYGNQGGYIALILYCFSPAMIRAGALWFAQPETGAAWGAFGSIFTAIAVAHTLYAPREVILWNWRRIGLLGLSLALAVGSQFSLLILVPVALAFMLYLAPTRRGAAIAIWAAACALAVILIFASYFFHANAFWDGLRQARFLGIAPHAFVMRGAYHQVLTQLGQNSPALVLAFPAALLTFLAWPRARYFGNLAPLLVTALLLVLAVGTPHYPGLGFQIVVLPFIYVFVSGVAADVLETPQRALAMACVWGLLAAQAAWNLWELGRVAG
jgi:Dolichyl-phosphate-mannose-protein mannosyltransferase